MDKICLRGLHVNCEKGNFNSAANKTNAHALLLKRLQMMWLVLHHLIGCKLVIILNNAQQLFDFLGTAQHSALRARLHRGHAGHGWGDMSFISWWSSSFALGSRCCQRRLKERNKAECGRMWKAVFWISLIGQLVYKWRHDNVQEYRQCQGMNVSWYESKCYILQRTVLVRFDGEGRLRSWSYFCVGLEMRPSLENYMQMRIKCI